MGLLKKKRDADYGRGDESKMKGVHRTNFQGHGNSAAGSYSKAAVKGNTSIPKHELNQWSKEEHEAVLNEMRSMPNPNLKASGGMVHSGDPEMDYAEGGCVGPKCPGCEMCCGGTVSHVMKKRMSEGGKVANEMEELADFEPNDFDELSLDDGLDFSYTGANSGDELGDEEEEKRRREAAHMIMMKRKMK